MTNAIVTKLNRAKRFRYPGRGLAKELAWFKAHAHRADRRACRQALRAGQDYQTRPRLTSWDII